jgi:hypothetical protein
MLLGLIKGLLFKAWAAYSVGSLHASEVGMVEFSEGSARVFKDRNSCLSGGILRGN